MPFLKHLLALGAVIAAASINVHAGQFCGELLEGGAVLRPTEAEARKDAENWWVSRAGSRGAGFQTWALAQDRKITCSEKTKGTFRCVATAKPCLPEGEVPNDKPKQEM